MAWCRQATNHYLSQSWHSSLSPYGVTRPQWVEVTVWLFGEFIHRAYTSPRCSILVWPYVYDYKQIVVRPSVRSEIWVAGPLCHHEREPCVADHAMSWWWYCYHKPNHTMAHIVSVMELTLLRWSTSCKTITRRKSIEVWWRIIFGLHDERTGLTSMFNM